MNEKELKPILLVEDDDADAELAIMALQSSKLANKIIRLHDGEEAIEYLSLCSAEGEISNPRPCVMLLDLKMPKVGGVEVLEHVRSSSDLKNIPVVILTSSKEDSDLRKCYELGVNAYVVKPVDFEQFTLAVNQLGFFWAVLNETCH